MIMDLYNFEHNVLHIHFWDIFAIITLALIVVVAGTHTILQKKREKDHEKENKKTEQQRSYTLRKEAA